MKKKRTLAGFQAKEMDASALAFRPEYEAGDYLPEPAAENHEDTVLPLERETITAAVKQAETEEENQREQIAIL